MAHYCCCSCPHEAVALRQSLQACIDALIMQRRKWTNTEWNIINSRFDNLYWVLRDAQNCFTKSGCGTYLSEHAGMLAMSIQLFEVEPEHVDAAQTGTSILKNRYKTGLIHAIDICAKWIPKENIAALNLQSLRVSVNAWVV